MTELFDSGFTRGRAGLTSHDQPINLPAYRLARLLQPFAQLDETQLADTLIYINLILKWNVRINLTGARQTEEIVTRHFGESFFAATHLLAPGESCSVIDLGAGAGFPGLPLAMAAPQARVTLIESRAKKAAFLNEVIRALGLGNATVFSGRGEDYSGKAELVTMRAVEKFAQAMPLAASLVQPTGRLALMIGKSQIDQAKAWGRQFAWQDATEVPGGHSRVLLLGTRKVKVE